MIRLYVGSRDRVAGTPSNFAIDLPESVVISQETHATIDRVLIPHSWYLIDDSNHRFYITEQTSGDLFHRVVDLDHGNYDKGGLSAETDGLNLKCPNTKFSVFAYFYSYYKVKVWYIFITFTPLPFTNSTY